MWQDTSCYPMFSNFMTIFCKDVLFEVFATDWCKIFILKISLKNFGLHRLESSMWMAKTACLPTIVIKVFLKYVVATLARPYHNVCWFINKHGPEDWVWQCETSHKNVHHLVELTTPLDSSLIILLYCNLKTIK